MRMSISRALNAHVGTCDIAVEAGCSVGPDIRTLRRHARHVIAFDSDIASLRFAHTQLEGHLFPRIIRDEGRSFHAEEPLKLAPVDGVTLVCGNALDPPLAAECADVAMAINLLDNVSEPINLVGQLDAILRPRGLMILTSPFAWRDELTPPAEQIGGGTIEAFATMGSEAALMALLTGRTPYLTHLDYEVLDTFDVPWTVRDHGRCEVRFRVFGLVARKG